MIKLGFIEKMLIVTLLVIMIILIVGILGIHFNELKEIIW